ncbi:hypothetical protein EI427_09965 [Flammeovirga pectinis]|uniref:Uncharacterized protein n=1 Tax=Flammeovirga pectinis TaxID=2494373 RepID=A0A3S9P363_9BACT|nr:hypothetical protein [Flammeovirga pectinis]AZQ62548.1 hypothetical protein EI427_09965 [Flammeovirga pectinis]
MQQKLNTNLNLIYIFLFLTIGFQGCEFFGLDKELDDLTIQDLELESTSKFLYLTPQGEWHDPVGIEYLNTRDSVFDKLFLDYNKTKNADFQRLTLSVDFPSDSSLLSLDSIEVFIENAKDEKYKLGYLYDIPNTTTEKSLDLIIENNASVVGNILKDSVVYFKPRFHFRITVRSDSMKFKVQGDYSITGQ